MESLEKKQADLIAACRFPLMLLVVFIHTVPGVLSPYGTVFHQVDLFMPLSRGIAQVLATLAVPGFYLLSGFLFFKKIEILTRSIYFEQIRKRAYTLLIPYLFWNLFFVALILLKNFLYVAKGMEVDDFYTQIQQYSFLEILGTKEFPINYPLWYLRDLMVMVLLAPVFYLFTKFLGVFGVALLIAINLAGFDSQVPGLNVFAITYFGIGSYLALNKINFLVPFSRVKYIAFIGATGGAILACFLVDSPYFKLVNRGYIFLGLITFFNGMHLLIQHRAVKERLLFLSGPVFFIYCTHGMYVIELLKGFFSRTFLAHTDLGLLVIYFLITFLVMASCTVAYRVLIKLFPSLLAKVLGGRA